MDATRLSLFLSGDMFPSVLLMLLASEVIAFEVDLRDVDDDDEARELIFSKPLSILSNAFLPEASSMISRLHQRPYPSWEALLYCS